MNEAELVELVAKVAETDKSGLTMDTELADLGWDSLSTLTFLAKAEQLLGQTVDANLLSSAKTVRDVFNLLPAV